MEISKTADQALLVLMDVANSPGRTPSDIARSLGMNRTVVHRLLATLERRGFLRRASEPATFVLGPTLLDLAERTDSGMRRIAEPVMRAAARSVGETVLLFAPNPRHLPPEADLVAQVIGDRHVVRVQYDTGHAVPLTRSAGGRAILAFMDPATARAAVNTSSDPAELEKTLAGIRDSGVAFSEAELLPGVCAIAAPVLGADDRALASIVIAAPTDRRDSIRSLEDDVVRIAADLAEALHDADFAGTRAPFDNQPALVD